jgi:hypothetical protein
MRRTRPFATALTFAAVLAASLVATPAQPATADAQIAAPVYEIEFQHSRLCLTVYNGSPMGSQPMQWNCDGYANGQWMFEFVDSSWAKIRNVHSGMCLTVYAGATWASPVVQWNCDGWANGLWSGRYIERSGGRDWYALRNKEAGLCLNISVLGPQPLGRLAILSGCAPTTYNNKATWYPPN